MKQIKTLDKSQVLHNSFLICNEIMRKQSSFFMAFYLTPEEKRQAIFAIYAWLREIDDIVDKTTIPTQDRINTLKKFHETTLMVLENDAHPLLQDEDSFWPAFKHTVKFYHIPLEDLNGMVKGQYQDLKKNEYQTFDELYDYCSLVASTVGSMCIHIWGFDGKKATKQMAIWCGVAFQLTNILRDFTEDLAINRIYLPAHMVKRQHLTEEEIYKIPREELIEGLQELISKAEMYYGQSVGLYSAVHKDGKLCFLIMYYTYRALLQKIKKNPEALLDKEKIKLTYYEKVKLMTVALYNHQVLHRI